MTAGRAQTGSQSRRLQAVIRRAYRGEHIDDATVAWLRDIPAEAVKEARSAIATNMWHRLIKLTTATPLFPGDLSAVSQFEFYDDVVSPGLAFDLIEDIGPEDASKFFEELAMLVSNGT